MSVNGYYPDEVPEELKRSEIYQAHLKLAEITGRVCEEFEGQELEDQSEQSRKVIAEVLGREMTDDEIMGFVPEDRHIVGMALAMAEDPMNLPYYLASMRIAAFAQGYLAGQIARDRR